MRVLQGGYGWRAELKEPPGTIQLLSRRVPLSYTPIDTYAAYTRMRIDMTQFVYMTPVPSNVKKSEARFE